MPVPDPRPALIAGLVLAGGRSRRFGAEKAAALFEGRPLLDGSLDVLAGPCGWLAVNAPPGSGAAILAAARHLDPVCDAEGGPDGPLSGVLAGLAWARTLGAGWLATVPCDTPRLPVDLVPRLIAAAGDGPGASADSPDGRQPLCAVWRVELLAALSATLRDGHPAVRAFQDDMGMTRALFADSAAFANLNRQI